MHEAEVDFMDDDLEYGIKLATYGQEAKRLSERHTEALMEQVVRQGIFAHVSDAKLWFSGFVG